MFENIVSFFKKLSKKNNPKESSTMAKERLHLVLMQDRANVSVDFLELMRQEIIEVIKKYIDIDEKAIDVKLTNKTNEDGTIGAPALYANIPIITIKDEARKLGNAQANVIKDDKKENNTEKKQAPEKQEEQNKDVANKEIEKEDSKQNEEKQDETKQEEIKKDETNNEEIKKEELNQEKTNKEETNQNETKQDETKNDEIKQDEVKIKEDKTEELQQEEAEKQEKTEEPKEEVVSEPKLEAETNS